MWPFTRKRVLPAIPPHRDTPVITPSKTGEKINTPVIEVVEHDVSAFTNTGIHKAWEKGKIPGESDPPAS